jgi:hypothetical protein
MFLFARSTGVRTSHKGVRGLSHHVAVLVADPLGELDVESGDARDRLLVPHAFGWWNLCVFASRFTNSLVWMPRIRLVQLLV